MGSLLNYIDHGRFSLVSPTSYFQLRTCAGAPVFSFFLLKVLFCNACERCPLPILLYELIYRTGDVPTERRTDPDNILPLFVFVQEVLGIDTNGFCHKLVFYGEPVHLEVRGRFA